MERTLVAYSEDIRVMDGQGKEVFRIPNGNYLQLTYRHNGFTCLIPCRYVNANKFLYGRDEMTMMALSVYVDSPDWYVGPETAPQNGVGEWWLGRSRNGHLKLEKTACGYDYSLKYAGNVSNGHIDHPEWSMARCRAEILMAADLEHERLICPFEESAANKRRGYSYVASYKNRSQTDIYVGGKLEGAIYANGDCYSAHIYKNSSQLHSSTRVRYESERQRGNYATVIEAKAAFRHEFEEYMMDLAFFGPSKMPAQAPKAEAPKEEGVTSYMVGKMLDMADWRGVDTVLQPLWNNDDCAVHTYATSFFYGTRGYHPEWNYVADGNVDVAKLKEDHEGIRVVADNFKEFGYATKYSYNMIVMCPPRVHPATIAEDWVMAACEFMHWPNTQFLCIMDAALFRASRTIQLLLQRCTKQQSSIKLCVKYLYKRNSKDRPQKEPLYAILYGKSDAEQGKRQQEIPKLREGEYLTSWEARLCASYRELVDDTDTFVQNYAAFAPRLSFGSSEMISAAIALNSGGYECGTSDRSRLAYFTNNYTEVVRRNYWHLLTRHPDYSRFDLPEIARHLNGRIDDASHYDVTEFNLKNFRADFEKVVPMLLQKDVYEKFLSLAGTLRCSQEDSSISYIGWNGEQGLALRWPAFTVRFNGYCGFSEQHLDVSAINWWIKGLERVLDLFQPQNEEWRKAVEARGHRDTAYAAKTMDFKYFKATFYKKGTCAIKFYPDTKLLIDRFNICVGLQQGWLPATYGRKPYAELSIAEKKIVDSFQGETFCEEVCAKPDMYLVSTEQLVEAAKK